MLFSCFFACARLWLGLFLLHGLSTLHGKAKAVDVLNSAISKGLLASKHQLAKSRVKAIGLCRLGEA